jgi:hypothetical protein
MKRFVMNDLESAEFLAKIKEAPLKIDPDTAEVTWNSGQICDPYGINPDLPPECDQVGRLHFAKSPGSDIWVCFYDLPKETLEKLREKECPQLTGPVEPFF